MTTTVTVQSHNYPVQVEVADFAEDQSGDLVLQNASIEILWPEDGTRIYHSTTMRRVSAIDLEYDHPSAVADRSARFSVGGNPVPLDEPGE